MQDLPEATLELSLYNCKVIEVFEYSVLTSDCNGNLVLSTNRRCGAGLFSNFSTLLWDLIECRKRGLPVSRLSAGYGLEYYKNHARQDPLSFLIKAPGRDISLLDFPITSRPDHHSDYSQLELASLSPYIKAYFSPTAIVKARIARLVESYGINLRNTGAICYRGTDKITEIARRNPSEYVCKHSEAMARPHRLDLRTLIQTDELCTRSYLQEAIGPNSFCFKEMPVTTGNSAIHLTPLEDRLGFAVLLYAVNLLLSKSLFLVTHTGNMAFWQALYRRDVDGFYQL